MNTQNIPPADPLSLSFITPITSRPPATKVLPALLGLLLLGAGLPVHGQTLLFDLGADGTPTQLGVSPNDPQNQWNNLPAGVGTSDTGVMTNLVTSGGTLTSLGLAMVRRFNGFNENGTLAATVYPPNATRDSFYGNTEPFNSISNIFPSFKLTGLALDTVYDFTFYASRSGVTDNRETGYTVTGGTAGFAALNASANIDNVAVVAGITPDASGEITISLAPTENNNNGNHFTYLGVLRIDAKPPQTPLGFTLEPVSRRVAQFEPVTFSAAVTGAPPHFVQWLSNDVAIPGANQFTYTIPVTTLDMSGSLFSVNVSNLAFSITSSNAALRVITDTNPPVLLPVATSDGMTIILTFNEMMDPITAGDNFYYSVHSSAGDDFFPQTAELRPGGTNVLLTLDRVISGEFKVTVLPVLDLSGNMLAPDSMAAGRVPGIEDRVFLLDFGAAGATATERGPAPDDPLNSWNNVTATIGGSDLGALPNLVTAGGEITDAGLVMVRRFNGANANGTTAPAPFPTDATRDSLFGNTEGFSGLTNIFPSFKLTGLLPSLSYSFTFFASRTGVGDNRTAAYTVEGANTGFATLNAANNVTNVAVVSGLRPTAAGEISISLAPAAANNNANHFTYLGVLKIQSALAQPRFTSSAVNGGQLTLEWVDHGVLEWAPTPLGPWTAVDPAPASPYSEAVDTGVNRFFRLRATP